MSCKPAAVALLSLVAACSRPGPPSVERIALVHLDNLTSSADNQWLGVAVPAAAAVSLSSSPRQFAFVASSTNDGYAGRATRFVRGYLTGGKPLVAHIGEFDARSGKSIAQWQIAGGTASQLGLGIARRLWPQAPALTPDLPSQPDAALRELTARLAFNVPAGKAEELARARPADSRFAALAGRNALIRRNFTKAGDWFNKAIAVDPENGPLHNEAAYVLFYAGKIEAALASLDQYNRLEPSSANPLDSRGEILLLAGRYAEAEEAFLRAYERDPRFFSSAPLRKAAVARRATGDQQGADALFQRYLDAIGGNPGTEIYRAQWDYESGRLPQAIAALEKLDTPPARLQLSVWRGQPEALGGTPQANALGLALKNDHAAAIPALQAVIAAERPMEATQWEVLLAWAYAQSGRPEAAKPLIARHPIPSSTPSFWESVVMLRYFQLKKDLP